jgi:hypothetical protein
MPKKDWNAVCLGNLFPPKLRILERYWSINESHERDLGSVGRVLLAKFWGETSPEIRVFKTAEDRDDRQIWGVYVRILKRYEDRGGPSLCNRYILGKGSFSVYSLCGVKVPPK